MPADAKRLSPGRHDPDTNYRLQSTNMATPTAKKILAGRGGPRCQSVFLFRPLQSLTTLCGQGRLTNVLFEQAFRCLPDSEPTPYV
jgi:hypothetical protein